MLSINMLGKSIEKEGWKT